MLLVVPLAIASPTLTWAWLLPDVLLLNAQGWSYGKLDRIVPTLAVVALAFAAPYAESAASTLSAWVSGFTFGKIFLTLPSSPTTNVERSTPM